MILALPLQSNEHDLGSIAEEGTAKEVTGYSCSKEAIPGEQKPCTGLPPLPGPINWSISPNTTASNPTIHDYIEATLHPVTGAKWYRIDRVKNMTGTTLISDPFYPIWFNNTQIVFRFTSAYCQRSAVVGPHYLMVSAWSEKPKSGGS